MFKKQSLRVILVGAGLAAASFSGLSRAADEPAAKPPQTAPSNTARRQFNLAEGIKNYRDQFEGLNLTDEQMKKIDVFLTTAETEIKALSGKEDQDSRREAFQAFRKLNEDVQSVLTDTQKTALRQKQRAMMFDRFKKSYTSPDLKLSEDQTKKINDIFDEAKKKMADFNPDDQESRRKGFELMRETTEKLNAVLTPEQQKQIPQFGGPRRGRGNGGTPPPAANQ